MKLPCRLRPFIPVLLLFLASCETPKLPATGEDDEIVVFADSSTWITLNRTLRVTFEDTVYTPQPEVWFRLRRVDFALFGNEERHKNRLVVAPMNDSGEVAQYVRNALDPSVRRLVEDRKEFFFIKHDSRARNQIVMFLTGVDLATMDASIRSRAADLLHYFKSAALKRELARFEEERKYAKHEIEQRLAERYGWTMTIQHDYRIAIDSATSRFFWIRRANPADMERWIFLHWSEDADPEILTEKYALAVRDSMTRQFMRTVDDKAFVEIAPYNLQIEKVDFLGRFAYEIRGNWRFSDKSGGGPFVNYTFYDETAKRIYTLDGSIFAPRVEKKKLILQVDGLLHTFRSLGSSPQDQKHTATGKLPPS
ncbi:MAG TPA: DUF4837 domain-containing protein [Bacteroidetes bacterium]|nr:DUF4837 domain-containing protein [Bacteroidota bacterium]